MVSGTIDDVLKAVDLILNKLLDEVILVTQPLCCTVLSFY